MSFKMTYFLLWNIKEDILKNGQITKPFQFPLISIAWTKITVEVNGNRNSLVTNILQNIVFCAPQKKETHTGLERHDGE